jgi:hypothetical protein
MTKKTKQPKKPKTPSEKSVFTKDDFLKALKKATALSA